MTVANNVPYFWTKENNGWKHQVFIKLFGQMLDHYKY